MPLTRKLQQLLDELAVIPDAHERLALLVDRARRVPPLPASDRTEANRVRGCVSVVWLVSEIRDGVCHFRADAESPVVRALVLLLSEFFSGATPAAIADSAIDPLEALDLTANLSPTRRNGLAAARAAIQAFAARHRA